MKVLYSFQYQGEVLSSTILEKSLDPKQMVVIETGDGDARKRDVYFIDEIALCLSTNQNTEPYYIVILDK